MSDPASCVLVNGDIEELRHKRVELILKVWDFLTESGSIDSIKFRLSFPLVNEVVEHYIDDVKAIKCRYKIKDRIQLHKVAGLMTSCIMRYRPIIPIVEEYVVKKESFANEIFAIIHGLAVCGEFSLDECETMSEESWFDPWLNDFLYLLHSRNHTPESLNFIFQTLCIFKFPRNFETYSY